MDKKILGIVLLISIVFISGTSTDFLYGIVNNYGDGLRTVGEVWTGYNDWNNYIRQSTPTITKYYASSYGEYTIDMSATFTAQNYAPIWYGLTHTSTGRYYEAYQRNIKVVQKIGSIWYEIPSQISADTQCFDNIGGATVCSQTYNKIKFLRLYATANITASNPEIKIFYPFAFLHSLDYEYKFDYNSTTNKYDQYNISTINYNDTTANYSPIIQYNSTNRKVTANNNLVLDFSSNWQLDAMYAGTSTYSTVPLTGDVFKAYGGTMIINGESNYNDVNASCVLEMEMDDANVMEQGGGTGALVLRIMPNIIEHALSSYVSDISPNNNLIESEQITSVQCLLGGTCDISPNFGNPIAYSNLTHTFISYNSTLNYNSTATNYAYSIAGGYLWIGDGYTGHQYSVNTPFVGILKSGNLKDSQGRYDFYNPNTYLANEVYTGLKYIHAPEGFIANSAWTGYIGLYQTSKTGYSNTKGFSTREIGESILYNEPNGGKIKKLLTFSSVCVPTSYTGNCNSENIYEWVGMACLSNNNLGYTDNCGNKYDCLLCDTCTDNGNTFSCDSVCIPKSTNSVTCDNGNLKIVDGCGTSYDNCTYGCAQNNCLTLSNSAIVNMEVYVNDPVNSTWIGGATVNIKGLTNQLDINQTTNYQGLTTFQIPASYDYSVYATKDGYTGGCYSPTIGNSFNNAYCNFHLPLASTTQIKFDIYPIGTTTNYTKATFITIFGDDIIPNVTVKLYSNGLEFANGTTNSAGRLNFVWLNFVYSNITVGASASGYSYITKPIVLNPLKDNTYTLRMQTNPSFNIYGLSGAEGNTIYAQLLPISDLPFNIMSQKSGKMVLTRVDFTVNGCVDWPFCEQKKLYWANCLGCHNCTRESQEGLKYIVPSWVGTDLQAAQQLLDNLTGTSTAIANSKLKEWVSQNNCDMVHNDNSTGLRLFGNNMYAAICLIQEGSNWVIYRYPILSGALTAPTMLSNGILGGVRGLIEILNPKGNEDIFIQDVIFRCNSETIASAIYTNTKFTVNYGGYQKTGTYIELITDPAFKDVIRTGNIPFLLPTGEISQNDFNSFYSDLPAYDNTDRNMYIGEYQIKVGNNNLGNSKKFTNAVTRNKLVGDIVSDLVAGNYISTEIKYADPDISAPSSESKKIDQPTLFQITSYIKAEFYPDDGGPKQVGYFRVLTNDTNLNPAEIFMQNILWMLLIIIFILPGISIFYLVFFKKGGK